MVSAPPCPLRLAPLVAQQLHDRLRLHVPGRERLADAVREHEIPAIFSESTISPKPAEQVARETGIAYGGVLYVDSLSEADGPVPTYLDLLRVTSSTIVAGLSQ